MKWAFQFHQLICGKVPHPLQMEMQHMQILMAYCCHNGLTSWMIESAVFTSMCVASCSDPHCHLTDCLNSL